MFPLVHLTKINAIISNGCAKNVNLACVAIYLCLNPDVEWMLSFLKAGCFATELYGEILRDVFNIF